MTRRARGAGRRIGRHAPPPACCSPSGHSARDTFEMLHAQGVPMEPKAVFHGRAHRAPAAELATEAQYGAFARHQRCRAADYSAERPAAGRLARPTPSACARAAYVVAAAIGGRRRGDERHERLTRATAKTRTQRLLVTLSPADFPDRAPLGGMYWQRQLEQTRLPRGREQLPRPGAARRRFSRRSGRRRRSAACSRRTAPA